ncbi:hypothetical protein GIB67_024257 [Kingdonia uniflora]|uniref:Malic enzyme NAD-binding domain-containing protein n=1 Tax=Kingdonia uniflora TaxID=39325 RepID=A0A7J7LZR1_9MAGN|nr:hypothetical protein GIB67_024257 [Kingdonia uniflora]
MLFFEKGLPVIHPIEPEIGLDIVLKNLIFYVNRRMRPAGIRIFRIQSPRNFEEGDWDQGGSCQRVQPLLPDCEQVAGTGTFFLYSSACLLILWEHLWMKVLKNLVLFSTGIGVLSMAKQAISRMTGDNKVTGNNPFWLLNKDGLVTKARNNIELSAAPFVRGFGPGEIEGLGEGASLLEVVKKVKPHVLLGLSGVGGIFTEEVLKAMQESDSVWPGIFAMLNPTTNG